MPHLFDPLTLRGVTLRNRVGISPMQQYCAAEDGRPTDWHLGNLLPRALGGAGLVFVEATAISPEGRSGNGDIGLWEDAQIPAHARLASAIAAAGAVPGVQLGHCGRKGSRPPQWQAPPLTPGWTTLAPSAVAFGDYDAPQAMTEADIAKVLADIAAATARAVAAGYRVIELHAAHGYLLHQFLSPLSNRRTDTWGGSYENRSRIVLDAMRAARAAMPDDHVLALRVSHTDWVEGGWTTEETVRLGQDCKAVGVDLFDVSSGGLSPEQKIPMGPGYQVPGGEAVRQGSGIAVATVGMITEAGQANDIVGAGRADMVLIAKASMRDPYWPLRAAATLGCLDRIGVAPQYERGWLAFGALTLDKSITAPLPALG
ncbi:oxidoreductase [Rhodovarius crocodyli]|uniref:Oxidoreductase n=1 Tax=Rhodovarius crocodyli TaxID=1979269 RepID=A0A437MP07_9PROT|nr:oxidoreductase [Rhodovarius crocodyli]RVT99385.1 oxidoreductase [Rhodovarius crocodyli]